MEASSSSSILHLPTSVIGFASTNGLPIVCSADGTLVVLPPYYYDDQWSRVTGNWTFVPYGSICPMRITTYPATSLNSGTMALVAQNREGYSYVHVQPTVALVAGTTNPLVPNTNGPLMSCNSGTVVEPLYYTFDGQGPWIMGTWTFTPEYSAQGEHSNGQQTAPSTPGSMKPPAQNTVGGGLRHSNSQGPEPLANGHLSPNQMEHQDDTLKVVTGYDAVTPGCEVTMERVREDASSQSSCTRCPITGDETCLECIAQRSQDTAYEYVRKHGQYHKRTRLTKRGMRIPKQTGKIKGCNYCCSNQETYDFYSSHLLHDKDGKVTCPVLRKFVCPICAKTGDDAHTLRYCPFNSSTKEIKAETNSVYECIQVKRNATGDKFLIKY